MSNPATDVHCRLTTGEGEHRRCLVHAAERLCSARMVLRPRYSCGLLIPSSHQRPQEQGSDASEGYGSSRGNSRVDALTSKEQRPACKRGLFCHLDCLQRVLLAVEERLLSQPALPGSTVTSPFRCMTQSRSNQAKNNRHKGLHAKISVILDTPSPVCHF